LAPALIDDCAVDHSPARGAGDAADDERDAGTQTGYRRDSAVRRVLPVAILAVLCWQVLLLVVKLPLVAAGSTHSTPGMRSV
jgi:hypothetical protein